MTTEKQPGGETALAAQSSVTRAISAFTQIGLSPQWVAAFAATPDRLRQLLRLQRRTAAQTLHADVGANNALTAEYAGINAAFELLESLEDDQLKKAAYQYGEIYKLPQSQVLTRLVTFKRTQDQLTKELADARTQIAQLQEEARQAVNTDVELMLQLVTSPYRRVSQNWDCEAQNLTIGAIRERPFYTPFEFLANEKTRKLEVYTHLCCVDEQGNLTTTEFFEQFPIALPQSDAVERVLISMDKTLKTQVKPSHALINARGTVVGFTTDAVISEQTEYSSVLPLPSRIIWRNMQEEATGAPILRYEGGMFSNSIGSTMLLRTLLNATETESHYKPLDRLPGGPVRSGSQETAVIAVTKAPGTDGFRYTVAFIESFLDEEPVLKRRRTRKSA